MFAVLTERVSWSVALKTVVFMPMAIWAFAAGVTWRIMYVKDPNQGAINARSAAKDAITTGRPFSRPRAVQPRLFRASKGGIKLETPVEPGDVASLGLTGIRRRGPGRCQAVQPEPL